MRRFVPGMRALLLIGLLVGCVAPRSRQVEPAPAAPTIASAKASASPAAIEQVPPPPPRSPFAYANIEPSDDLVVGPPDVRPTCADDLVKASIVSKKAGLPIVTKKKITCGAPQALVYKGGPAKIAYSPSVLTTCTMALALARFETIVQEEAKRTFGKRVVRIHHVGTYACREMAAYPGWVSEHSYANAIDLTQLVLEDGRAVDVLKHFAPKTAAAKTKEGTFLRAISRRAYDEEVFSSVLTPFFDKLHANHFHLDLARFRSDGVTYLGE